MALNAMSLPVKLFNKNRCGWLLYRCFSSEISAVQENAQSSNTQGKSSNKQSEVSRFSELAEYRFIYPEFLPDPKFEFRNKIREKLERMDMLKRRSVINIPEFYVGSILAVTYADPHSPGKENRFVGICISRTYAGLRATFTLRNVVDKQGIEIMFDMYDPVLHTIDVLRLEKRLDDELLYLRDAPPEYSTFPFDMEPEFIEEGASVPVNPIKVKLKPPPWYAKWELFNYKGIEPFTVSELRQKKAAITMKPWESKDIMKEYRRCIPEEEQQDIWMDVEKHKQEFQLRKQQLRKKTLLKAPKSKK